MCENKHYDYKVEGSASYAYSDPYSFYVQSQEKTDDSFTGDVYICDYRIIDSDENHPAKEGYEWRAFDLEIEFYCDLSVTTSLSFTYILDNFYDHSAWSDDNSFDLVGTEWEYYANTGMGLFVNHHGKDYPCIVSLEGDGFISDWYMTNIYDENGNAVKMYRCNFSKSIYACVPIGYDGVVYGLKNPAIGSDVDISDPAYNDALFFRMDNTMVEW